MRYRFTSLCIGVAAALSLAHARVAERALTTQPRFDFSNYKYYGTWSYPDDVDQYAGLRIMVSNDALHWVDIDTHYTTNNPTGRVSNAMVMWANGKFNLYTCGGPAQTIQIAYSTDGHTYTNYVNPPYKATDRGDFASDHSQTWSGNWFIDRAGHIYVVWSSSAGRMYYIRAIDDRDLGASFGDPVRITGSAVNLGIDPTIYDDGINYYLIYQSLFNDSADDRYITIVKSSTSPFSGYNTLIKHGDWNPLGGKSDSPILYFGITGSVWSLYVDDWGASGVRRVQLRSGDWRIGTDKWGPVQQLRPTTPRIRAGSFILVPK